MTRKRSDAWRPAATKPLSREEQVERRARNEWQKVYKAWMDAALPIEILEGANLVLEAAGADAALKAIETAKKQRREQEANP